MKLLVILETQWSAKTERSQRPSSGKGRRHPVERSQEERKGTKALLDSAVSGGTRVQAAGGEMCLWLWRLSAWTTDMNQSVGIYFWKNIP